MGGVHCALCLGSTISAPLSGEGASLKLSTSENSAGLVICRSYLRQDNVTERAHGSHPFLSRDLGGYVPKIGLVSLGYKFPLVSLSLFFTR